MKLWFARRLRVPAVFVPKNEYAFGLGRALSKFAFSASTGNGEFARSRVRSYDKLQRVLVDNHRSTVRAQGLRTLFYARYFTAHALIVTQAVIPGVDRDANLVSFLRQDECGPTKAFESLADKEIDETLRLSDDSVRKRDSFRTVLETYFNSDDMATRFIGVEQRIFESVKHSKELQDEFNTLNRETQPWAERVLLADIKRLEPNGRRLERWWEENQTLRGVVGGGVVLNVGAVSWARFRDFCAEWSW